MGPLWCHRAARALWFGDRMQTRPGWGPPARSAPSAVSWVETAQRGVPAVRLTSGSFLFCRCLCEQPGVDAESVGA